MKRNNFKEYLEELQKKIINEGDYISIEDFEDAFYNMVEIFADNMPGNGYFQFGAKIGELFIDVFKDMVYGSYPIEAAQKNLDEAMAGLNSIPKQIPKQPPRKPIKLT